MRCITVSMANKLTHGLWISMMNLERNLGKKTQTRLYLNHHLHDRLEGRIKFGVMIPLEWRLNTLLER